MTQHSIFFIIFIISIICSTDSETSIITTNIKNSIDNVKNNIIAEQTKTSADSYDNENLEQITTSGSYHYTGEITTTITIQKNSGIVHLYLENAHFSNTGKIIDSKNGVNLIITLIGENTISNSDETSNNAISINQDITINGQGSLTIISTKNGIKCDGKFYGLGGNLLIRSKNHGISSDSIYIAGTIITIEETGDGKDGFHAESDYDGVSEVPSFDFLKGFVYIESGTITIQNCKGDGIQADSFVYIVSGNINIQTVATWESFTATSNGMKGCFSKSENTYKKVPSDNVRRGTTYYILSNSCKGIKVGEIDYFLKDDETETEQIVSSSSYTILIEGGTIEINSPDDSIHTNSGNALIYGGNIKISTLDDGITADLNLIVKDGQIDIETCFEGLEAQFVEIQGGNIKIIADDDGINAAGGRESQILFSGGKTYVYAKGDGIDSNGDLIVNDGEIYVLQTGGMNGALDSDGNILINGGTLIAVGSSSMPEIPSSSSKQCVIVRKIQSTSSDISLDNNSGETLANFQISSIFGVSVSYSLVILSSSSIKKCNYYDIKTGSSINSVQTSGSSTVTSNARGGWGGGGTVNNDGENCPSNDSQNGGMSTGNGITISSNNNENPPNVGSSTNSINNSNDNEDIESSIEDSDIRNYESESSIIDDFHENLSDKDKGKGLPIGAIIGIVVACVVVAALAIALISYFLILKKKKDNNNSNDEEVISDAY